MLVTAINRTDDLLLVGHKYLLPGEWRRVTLSDFVQARAHHGAGLESHDAPPAAYLMVDDLVTAVGDEAASGAVALDDEPDEYSLDVLDGDADGRDLYALTRAELAEMARMHGIVPGRRTKRELIEAIHEYAE